MKSSIVYSFLVAALFIAGCRKEDNPKVPELEKVPLPQITLKDGGNKIPGDAPTSFNATVTVDVYYKFGLQPKSLDLVVIKNGDRANPKTIQADITTFPTDVTVSGQQLTDLFGAPIALGDAFNIGADVITQDDKRFSAFPASGTTYAPGIANLPGISTQLTFAAPCLFVADEYTAGEYEVVVDEWEVYAPGDVVEVTKIDDTHYSFLYPIDNPKPIIMEVNPVTNEITVPTTLYGDFGGINVTVTSLAGSEVDPCELAFNVVLNHVADPPYGDQGNYLIRFKKL